MRLAYHRRRLADFAAAVKESRAGAERERWPRERLRAFQQERLDALVRHAASESPYYRERLADLGPGPVRLDQLPTIDKARTMEDYDEIVTDRRLRRDELLDWIERLDHDELGPGGHRVMATSGSSGRKGLFAYDEAGWRTIASMFLQQTARMGLTPRLPRRRRLTIISGASFAHMSRQGAAAMGLGAHRVLGLPVSMPLDRLVAALNEFQPEYVNTYPSVAGRLAEEQMEGRLRLSLTGMSTSSEVRTPAMTERLIEAFGVHPYDLYATTEGVWAAECEQHAGLHLFEDRALVENVDADGAPVAPGEPGAKLLVTNLTNRVQPIIRLELPDVVAIDPEPCPCGRTLMRVRAIEGRSDDVIDLPGRAGHPVSVLPIEFGLVTRDRDVREFQVVQEGAALRLLVVPRSVASAGLDERLRAALEMRLRELGVEHPAVAVERRDALPRSAGGKLQVVVAEPRGAPAAV